MKAIITKFLPHTNTKPMRVKAYDSDGNCAIVPMGFAIESNEDLHRRAAEALCTKMGWSGKMICGGIIGGYAFVFTGEA